MRFLLFMVLMLTVSHHSLVQEVPEDLPNLSGKIAFVGDDYNIYILDSDANGVLQLTDDADRSRRYQWPTWSTDGRLAFFCCDLQFSERFALEVFIAKDITSSPKLIYRAENEGYTYAFWSPANCPANDTCRDLSVLINRAGEPFKIELIRHDDTPSSLEIGNGAPYYHTWSHDGTQQVWQRNGQLLSIYEVEENRSFDLPFENGNAQVPIWSPIKNELLLAVRSDDFNLTDLIILADAETRELQKDIEGTLWLSWSPDGRYIAYSIVRENQGALVVLDADSGEVINVTTPAQIVSFFWSPDSEKIAYITPSQISSQGATLALQPQEIRLAWSVLDVQTGFARTFEGFTPTTAMIYLISFFDQFAPSHAVWSPDSRYLIYAEVVNGLQDRISILDTFEEDTVTYPIADGSIGIWSFD